MASFGESLRREREMRGVSLEEISATTKVNVRFLQALEAENFAKIPGGIFTRSFLRAYAGYLGLDTERVLAEYQLVAPPAPECASRFEVAKLRPGRPSSMVSIVPWLVAVPLLAAGYALYRYSHRTPEVPVSLSVSAPVSNPPAPTEQNAPANAPPQGSAAGTPAADREPAPNPAAPTATTTPSGESLIGAENSSSGGQSKLPVPGLSAAGAAAPSSENASASQVRSPSASAPAPIAKGPDGNLVLEVSAIERAWVAVDADGKTIFQSTLSPYEAKTFTARDSFEVFTGNAQGTVLTLNGARQRSLGREGEVKRIRLTRNGLEQPAP
jgi:cytoskeleton protein RodZ